MVHCCMNEMFYYYIFFTSVYFKSKLIVKHLSIKMGSNDYKKKNTSVYLSTNAMLFNTYFGMNGDLFIIRVLMSTYKPTIG